MKNIIILTIKMKKCRNKKNIDKKYQNNLFYI